MTQRPSAWALVTALGALLSQPLAAETATASSESFERAVHCMTLAIAHEAGYEPLEGRQAVAEVILNRTRHPAYPKSVCGVVFQGSQRRTGCQFTFTCDGALARKLPSGVLSSSREIARSVMAGEVASRVGGATHYHANYVSPYWAPSLIRVGRIGAHIFYRAPGSVDLPARYAASSEPQMAALRAWLSAPDALTRPGAPDAAKQRDQVATAAAPFAPWGLPLK